MSKKTHLSDFNNLYLKFLKLKPDEFKAMQFNFDSPNIMTFEEAKKCLDFILDTFNGVEINDNWSELSLYAITNLETILQRTIDHYIVLGELKDEDTFSKFTSSIDFLAHFLRMAGVVGLATDSIHQQKTNLAISNEFRNISQTKLEIQNLEKEVKKLITPAIAGSLSNAFKIRKRTLFTGRIIWLVILIIVSGFTVYETKDFATSFSNVLLEIQKTKQSMNLLWESLILRSVTLLPLYIAFGVSFSQYKKERDFEEEYAHKEAVAISLPNYGDLTREPAVRDQIVSAATSVIFSTPINKKTEPELSKRTLDYMKEVLITVTKLIPRKD